MSKTTDFILNNPGKNFDGSPIEVNEYQPALLSEWQGLSKQQIATRAQDLVGLMLERGNTETVAEQIAVMAEFIEKVRKDATYINEVRGEISKHGGKLHTASGAVLELMEGGTKYHYENTGDAVIIELQAKAKAAAEAVKEREKFLQALPKEGLQQVDTETGAIYMLYPPYKTSTSTFKITLAK